MIFVFGSNEAGRHGAGAARFAYDRHGAVMGHGFGPAGNSWAIPTKDWRVETLPLRVVEDYVGRFVVYARFNPQLTFQVTQIGCGLAGLTKEQVAPMFRYAPENCLFDEAWAELLPKLKPERFWGTF